MRVDQPAWPYGCGRIGGLQPDGRLLASSSSDVTIRLWDVEAGISLQTLRSPGLYAGMKIAGSTGITEAQKVALKLLGAVDETIATWRLTA